MAAALCGKRAASQVEPSAAHASLQFPPGALATKVWREVGAVSVAAVVATGVGLDGTEDGCLDGQCDGWREGEGGLGCSRGPSWPWGYVSGEIRTTTPGMAMAAAAENTSIITRRGSPSPLKKHLPPTSRRSR